MLLIISIIRSVNSLPSRNNRLISQKLLGDFTIKEGTVSKKSSLDKITIAPSRGTSDGNSGAVLNSVSTCKVVADHLQSDRSTCASFNYREEEKITKLSTPVQWCSRNGRYLIERTQRIPSLKKQQLYEEGNIKRVKESDSRATIEWIQLCCFKSLLRIYNFAV